MRDNDPFSGVKSCSLQALRPDAAKFCLAVEHFYQKNIGLGASAGHKLLLAFSAGVDSTALLLSLLCLSKRLNLELTVAHLDHGLRPESALEAEKAADLCRTLGLHCHVERKDVRGFAEKNALGLEEAGRILRYKFLEARRAQTGSDLIATGHQLNDLAEDVLMRLVRGTGWPALGGMRALDRQRRLCRPLLFAVKESLQSFVRSFDLDWCEDASNTRLDGLRNRIRHTVLPLLVRENPGFMTQVAGLWHLSVLDETYWDERIEAVLKRCRIEFYGDRVILIELPADCLQEQAAFRLRLYKSSLERLGPGQALRKNLFQLDRAWRNKRFPSEFQFPGHKRACLSKRGICFKVE